jgi:hypothetical protein
MTKKTSENCAYYQGGYCGHWDLDCRSYDECQVYLPENKEIKMNCKNCRVGGCTMDGRQYAQWNELCAYN